MCCVKHDNTICTLSSFDKEMYQPEVQLFFVIMCCYAMPNNINEVSMK